MSDYNYGPDFDRIANMLERIARAVEAPAKEAVSGVTADYASLEDEAARMRERCDRLNAENARLKRRNMELDTVAEQARAGAAAELHAARMVDRDIYFANVQRFDALYFAAVNVCIEHQRGTYADDKDLDLLCKALNDWEETDDDEEVARVRAERKAHEEAEAALRKILNADALDVHSIARAWLEAHP